MPSSPAMGKDDSIACSPLAQLQPVLQSTASPPLPPKAPPGNHGNRNTKNEPSTSPTSSWDDDFFSFSTPTPKPPPRLAPMVSASTASSSSSSPTRIRIALRDLPTPLIIPSPAASSSTPATTSSIARDPHSSAYKEDHPHSTIRPPPRLGVATTHGQRRGPAIGSTVTTGGGGLVAHISHHRTQSYSQFHSNALGTDLFDRSPDTTNGPMSSLPSTVPSQPSAVDQHTLTSPVKTTQGPTVVTTTSSPPTTFDPDRQAFDHPLGAAGIAGGGASSLSSSTSSYPIATRPYSLTATASPAATRSASPSLTPSNSQSNLFSNLPSPLPHANLTSSLRGGGGAGDHGLSLDSKHKLFSSWIASHPPIKPVADDNQNTPAVAPGESEQINYSTGVAHDPLAVVPPPPSTSSSARKYSVASISTHASSGSHHHAGKIYPGLKNSVGPYKLIHSIGRGSFSEVKLAVDTRTGEQVAVKVMSRAVVQSSDRLGVSVRRESELLQSIHHVNIIGFREVVETSIQTCIVLDYAPGGELFEYVINNRTSASELDLQCIFSQIVDAVDYLHARNVVHRDLKLENVLLVPRTTTPLRPIIKLTDFGLARVIEEDSPLLTTRCGSEDYAAPEIILGQPYDGREADMWSLGVILYALLVGFLPFNQDTNMSRKTFLHMIATADFGFPGEKILVHPRKEAQTQAQATMVAGGGGGTTQRVGSQCSLKDEVLREAEASFHPNITTTHAADYHQVSNSSQLHTSTTTTAITTATADLSVSSTKMSSISHVPQSTNEAPPPPKGRTVPAMKGVSPASEVAKQLVRQLLQMVGSKRPLARDLKNDPWVVTGRTTMWE